MSEPTREATGTIVIFSGGGGTGLWATPNREEMVPLYQQTLDEWLAAGFRIVRVQWDESWFEGGSETEGYAALACRPATVINWIADHLVEPGLPLCVGGGSGGAAQISYTLAHYGLKNRISLAVPWSGFWMGRVDIGCLDEDPRNSSLHYMESARRTTDLTLGFSLEEEGPCLRRDPSFEAAFAGASTSVGGDYFYPTTLVWHILAGSDQVGALAQGLTYYEAMLRAGSPHVRVDVLPDLPHALASTELGMGKIRDAFLHECRLR